MSAYSAHLRPLLHGVPFIEPKDGQQEQSENLHRALVTINHASHNKLRLLITLKTN